MFSIMNNNFATLLTAAMVFTATSGFSQKSGHSFRANRAVTPAAQTAVRMPQQRPNCAIAMASNPKPNIAISNRNMAMDQVQDSFMVTAVVAPASLDNRNQGQRTLRVLAPTKSAANARMRQMIDVIGVPYTVISWDLTSL